MKRFLLLLISSLLLTSAFGQQNRFNVRVDNPSRYHPGRVIVRFQELPQFIPGSAHPRVLSSQLHLFLVDNPSRITVPQAIARYARNPNVIYAEPDYEAQAVDTTPGDPMWSQQWDMVKIQAPTAWDTQTDSGDVVVAVVDTGIAFTHPDLQANLWRGHRKAHGYTCIDGSCVVGGADNYGHGTHVAGTIGAAANNGAGIAGINWSVQLLSIKFLDSSGGGYISDAILAFDKIAQLKAGGVNIRVTNNSWVTGEYTQSLKDAMASVEAEGILNICAAGNSGGNSDVEPLYPAAYDNRGILSVAASDSSDAGASFSNIGLASVDIAAPGVAILSTVPTGFCSLCDSSGYKFLSGTSMSTPHVAGVAAALFHLNPLASPAKVRDVLLDSASYDVMTDAQLKVTSTGGRLNFAKALSNPKLSTGSLNNFPTILPLPDIEASAGQQISLSASGSDSDAGDVLRFAWAPMISGSSIFASMLKTIFPTSSLNTNPYSFKAPSLSRPTFATYVASVADGRGGSATEQSIVKIAEDSNPNQPPSGTLTLSTHDLPSAGWMNVNFQLTDPERQQPLYWQVWLLSSNIWSQACCFTGSIDSYNLAFGTPGVYRISVQGIDNQLNVSPKYSDVVRVGGATGIPPTALANVDKLYGEAPLTVNIDMSASYDPDGTISNYGFYCADGSSSSMNSQGSCTYNDPGTYDLWTTVTDTTGLRDAYKTYITVLPSSSGSLPPPPPPPTDTTPPNVEFVTPSNGDSVARMVTIELSASDDTALSRAQLMIDGGEVASTSDQTLSYKWNTRKVQKGNHTLKAQATDTSNNVSSTSITVKVE